MILFVTAFNGPEEEAKEVLKSFYNIGPVENTLAMHPYPKVNNLVPTIIGMRSSMKGAAFQMPLRAEFVASAIAKYDEFLGANPDAAPSLVAWELIDTVKLTALESGSYANRGYHMNGLVMPTWSKKENVNLGVVHSDTEKQARRLATAEGLTTDPGEERQATYCVTLVEFPQYMRDLRLFPRRGNPTRFRQDGFYKTCGLLDALPPSQGDVN